jgi:hypothetical protein
MKPVADYETYCMGMTVREALDILEAMNVEDEKIIYSDVNGSHAVSIWDFCYKIPDSVLASSIEPIQFSGGPPGQYFWAVGSLNTLVMDKLMYRDAIEEVRYGSHMA